MCCIPLTRTYSQGYIRRGRKDDVVSTLEAKSPIKNHEILLCEILLLKEKRIILYYYGHSILGGNSRFLITTCSLQVFPTSVNGSSIHSAGQDVNWRYDLDSSHLDPTRSTSSISSSLLNLSVTLEEPLSGELAPASSCRISRLFLLLTMLQPPWPFCCSLLHTFFTGAAPSYIPISNARGSSFSTSSPIPVTICPFDYNHPGCKVIFH